MAVFVSIFSFKGARRTPLTLRFYHLVELLQPCTNFHRESMSPFRQSNEISPTPAAAPSLNSDGVISRDVKANQIRLNIPDS